MADQYTKVLEIQLNYEKTIKGIAEYEKQLRECKEAQDAIKQALKDETITREQYDEQMAASRVQMKQLKTEQAALIKEVQQNVKAENAQKDSLVQLRAELSNLTAKYDALSGAEREAATGAELQKHILEVTAQLKEAEFATERFYRNVGNYEKGSEDALSALRAKLEEAKAKYKELVATEGEASAAAKSLKEQIEAQEVVLDKTGQICLNLQSSILPFGDKLVPLLTNGMKGIKQAFSLAAEGAKILGKQFVALMANPIVAFLALVAAAIAIVVKGISGSEENMNKWHRIMAPVQRGLAALQSVIQTLCGWILNFVAVGEGVLMFLSKMAENLPIVGGAFRSVNEAVEESIKLEQEKIAIEKQERENIVQNAKDALEVAKLRSEAQDKEHKTAEERLEANQKAQKILQEQADREVELAERKLKALQKESEWADNDAETNRELAQLEAAVYQAREKQYQQTLRLQKQEQSLRDEIEKDAKATADAKKAAAEKAVQTAKDRASKEQEAIRKAEDAMLSLIKDNAEKQRRQIELNYAREIEDLKKKLVEEQNLTAAARDAIRQTIQSKEQQMANELADLEAQISQEEIARQQEKIQLRLEAVKQGTDQEYQLKMQAIDLERQAELARTEQEIANVQEREEMKALIVAKYAAQERQLAQDRDATLLEEEKQSIANSFTERMMQVADNQLEQAQIELEQRQLELDNMHRMEDESQAAFYARQLQAQKEYNEAKKKLTATEKSIEQGRLQVAKSVTSGLSSLFAELGESNKEFAKLSKVLALANIAIDTGMSIASVTAKASEAGWPAMIPIIAGGVATIMANIVSAISTVKEAKFAKGGKVERDNYADGGKIRGAGTGTSDSIPAWLSNGEFVMTANATRMFEPTLAAMNEIGRGITPQVVSPFSLSAASPDLLGESMAAAVSEIHPVVSVVDINEGQQRVDMIDTLDTI